MGGKFYFAELRFWLHSYLSCLLLLRSAHQVGRFGTSDCERRNDKTRYNAHSLSF